MTALLSLFLRALVSAERIRSQSGGSRTSSSAGGFSLAGNCLKLPSWFVLIVLLGSLALPTLLVGSPRKKEAPASERQPAIVIDYPAEGSVFPPEITPPTFLWRDMTPGVNRWVIEVSFKNGAQPIRLNVAGDYLQIGEIDPQAASDDDLIRLTPQQAATRTWKPDAATWSRIKQNSVGSPATIAIAGLADSSIPVSSGAVRISTAKEPVGAPVFYRDVPLMLPTREAKGSIQPLPPFAIPLIKWKLRDISKPQSRTVMQNLPTCANCHSFSADGKTFGLDLDGPKNDKGLYALVPVAQHMTIRNQDVIRWSSFLETQNPGASETAVKRFGFMSQVSPDGRYIVTSIGPPGLKAVVKDDPFDFAPGLADRLYSINYRDVHFTQVFYPTRGILAWYDRVEQKMRPLPGADDPKFVHTSAFWSPDGKYLIFSRATARDSYPTGAPKPEYANDPRETQIQYDLYRIPFNEGRGGKAEPIVGASQNGMSNNFPKVSPDGNWIVFVQNKNGLLMRPDSKLYIVPFNGGKARLMKCNTSRMNSWHTFSPNGRWMAFSSKARAAYTQLMLTYIDEDGNDTPAIVIENATLANRAVNIPEFVNIQGDTIENIDPQATEFYRLFNQAYDLIENKKWAEAATVMKVAVERDPEDALGHFVLATTLSTSGYEREASEEYRKACALQPSNAAWLSHFAVSLANIGDFSGAVENWRKSLALEPNNPGAEAGMGTALFELGYADDGQQHLQKAIAMAPTFPDAYNHLGWELAKRGRIQEGIPHLQKAIELKPDSVEYRANLGYVLTRGGNYAAAVDVFQKAVEVSGGRDWRVLDMLAHALHGAGRIDDAVEAERRALSLAVQQQDTSLERKLQNTLERYQREGARAHP